MKSKILKRSIAIMLCMVIVLSGSGYLLAETFEEGNAEVMEASVTDVPAEDATVQEETTEAGSDATVEVEIPAQQEEPSTPAAEAPAAEAPAAETPAEESAEPILQLTYENDDVKVIVDATKAGNIPDGATLSVTPLEKKEVKAGMSAEEKAKIEEVNAQYDLTETKLQEKAENEEYDIAGFLAYDITFVDADGNKLEPNGDVKVSMEYKKAVVPEEVKQAEAEAKANNGEYKLNVTIMHLEEDANGTVREVVDMVADPNEKATVKTTETTKVSKAEFVTDSFSTYVLTWNGYASDINQLADGSETVEILNDIATSGSLQAKYNGSVAVESYQWFKCDSKDGTYTAVEKKEYQGDKTNISEDGILLYPAFDGGARKWYKVSVTLSDGTTIESEPFQVPYYNSLQNGSFETPVISRYFNSSWSTSYEQWSNEYYASKGGVWQTTGTKNGQDIEIVSEKYSGTKNGYSWYGNWSNAAPDGFQFAELNCEAAGALYQDVLTIEGTPLNYWMSHRARGNQQTSTSEYDTMFLVIMPTEMAIGNDLTTQSNLNTFLSGLGVDYSQNYSNIEDEIVYDHDGVLVVRVTSDDQSWHNVSKILGYTPTASLTRFFFMSGATDSGSDTVGNFLDNVGFSQELPPVNDDEFTIQIEKKFKGLGNEDVEKVKSSIQFVITAKKNGSELNETQIQSLFGTTTINGSDMKQLVDGSLVYTLANRKISGQYEVTITEINAENTGYSLKTEAKTTVTYNEGDSTEEAGSVIKDLKGKTKATVKFTNTYERSDYKNINFTKVWDDNNNAFNTRPANLVVTLSASITVEKDGAVVEETLDELSQTATLNEDNGWKCSWKVPVYYDYNGTKVKISYKVTEGENNSAYVYESPSNGVAVTGNGEGYSYTNFDKVTTTGDSDSILQESVFKKLRSIFSLNASPSSATTYALDSDATEATDSGLGDPAHSKYIEYNANTAEYTLNLDVTGKKGETTGADILFVIDTSGSMKGSDGYLAKIKSLLTKDNGIIDQIFQREGNVNSVAYVSFAGKNETTTSSWYQTAGKSQLKQKINNLTATGGTNWTYAMQQASTVLAQKSSSQNEKIVIFLSDGEPTYSIDRAGKQTGNGSDTKKSYYSDAADVVEKSSSLSSAQMYSVYLTTDTQSGMKKFSDKLSNSELVNGTDLEKALKGILNKVIPTYKNVIITDELSEYVEFAETSPAITVKKKTASGEVTVLDSSQYQATVSGKTVQVSLLNGDSLEDGSTYTVSFKVKPSEEANGEYSKKGKYPHTGEAGTGATSAGQDGFYSNNDSGTKVTYTVNDEKGESSYPMPVVQVTTHKLSYEKIWNKPDSVEEPMKDIVLNVVYTDGTTKQITLTADADYKYEETVPVTKRISSITEELVDGYTPSYSISSDGTNAVVTNSYSKVVSSSIKVKKEWNGNGPKTPVRVSLWQSADDGSATQYGDVITLSDENDWQYTWNKLPQSAGSGNDIVHYTYAVREENIPANYTSNIVYSYGENQTVATITNIYDSNCADEDYYIANILQTETWTINKTWNDSLDSSQRPSSLKVTVNGMNFYLKSSDNWTKTVTVLKKQNAQYDASEDISGSTAYEQSDKNIQSTSNGVTISFVNQLKTKTITVYKAWNDGDITSRPRSIQFRLLYRSGDSGGFEEYGDGVYTITEEDEYNDSSWTKVINNLPAMYEYKIEEINEMTGYNTEVTNSGDNFTITNTLKWGVRKTSEQLADEDVVNLQGAKFELKNSSNAVIATGISGSDGIIAWTVAQDQNVDLQKLNGTYTIEEKEAPEGYILNESGWTLTFDNGLLTKLDGEDITSGTATEGVIINITNKKLYTLPSTGGPGIFWYTISGILLMMAAALILYKNKCREVLNR